MSGDLEELHEPIARLRGRLARIGFARLAVGVEAVLILLILRTLLLPKYEGRAITGEYDSYAGYESPYRYLPVNRADFEWLAEYRLARTSGGGVSLDGELDLSYVPFTQELYDQFMELYNSIDRSTTWSEDIRDIVTEAAGGYFAGDKSLDDTAREVQSRVSLYVNEQK